MAQQHHIAQITIILPLDREITPEIAQALDALASVMFVQAEDGVYTLGSPESESDEVENKFLAHVIEGGDYFVKVVS